MGSTFKDWTWEGGGSGMRTDKASRSAGLSSASAGQQESSPKQDCPGEEEVILETYSKLCRDDLVIIPRFGKFPSSS